MDITEELENLMWDYESYYYGKNKNDDDEVKPSDSTDNPKDLKSIVHSLVTEINTLQLSDDDILIIKLSNENYTTEFINEFQRSIVAVFGVDFVKSSRVMIIPEGVTFEKAKHKKPHPVYGD